MLLLLTGNSFARPPFCYLCTSV